MEHMRVFRVMVFAAFFATGWHECAGQILLRGMVVEKAGAALPQAHILIYPDSITTVSNDVGEFETHVQKGSKTIQVSYVGFEFYHSSLSLQKDSTIFISLIPSTNHLREVVVNSTRSYQHDIFSENRTSTQVLTRDEINAIPV